MDEECEFTAIDSGGYTTIISGIKTGKVLNPNITYTPSDDQIRFEKKLI